MHLVSPSTQVQTVGPFMQVHAQGVSDFLKILLVILALISVVLAVTGENRDKETMRITPTGYGTLITAILVAVCGIASWFSDREVKDLSDQKTAAAVDDQRKEDKQAFDTLNQYMIDATNALELAKDTEDKTFSIAMAQLPVEQIEVSMPRSEVEASLPAAFKTKNFYFQKPRGYGEQGDDFSVQLDVLPMKSSKQSDESMRLLDSFQTEEQAWKSFFSVYNQVCRIEISPSSIGEDKLHARDKVGTDEFYLTNLTLSDKFLTFDFSPATFSAAQFDGSSIRLEVRKSHQVAMGGAKLQDTLPCVRANNLQIMMRTVKSVANTGLFHANWKEEYTGASSYSPMIKLQPATSRDKFPSSK